MKRIEAVIRPESLEPVLAALKAAGTPGVMVSEIEGYGKQRGVSQSWRGQEYRVELLPKVKIDVIVANNQAESIVNTISGATKTGKIGDGKIFITDVADAIRIRTGERGDASLS